MLANIFNKTGDYRKSLENSHVSAELFLSIGKIEEAVPVYSNCGVLLKRWQDILRLRDWDIKPIIVRQKWKKSGDIKIDRDNRMATVIIHESTDPAHFEDVAVHKLLHLRLDGMDQMIETNIDLVFDSNSSDPKRNSL